MTIDGKKELRRILRRGKTDILSKTRTILCIQKNKHPKTSAMRLQASQKKNHDN